MSVSTVSTSVKTFGILPVDDPIQHNLGLLQRIGEELEIYKRDEYSVVLFSFTLLLG